jgi:hypothetical protein
MCGIDFVTPFQGLNLFWGRCSQGVALGCPILRLWRGKWRPERPEQERPGQSKGAPWIEWSKGLFALKGRNNFHQRVAVTHFSSC